MIAPVVGSGVWPAWIARVPKPGVRSLFMARSLANCRVERQIAYAEGPDDEGRGLMPRVLRPGPWSRPRPRLGDRVYKPLLAGNMLRRMSAAPPTTRTF